MKRKGLGAALAIAAFALGALGQDAPQPLMVDEFATRGNNCEEMFARLDGFFTELHNNPSDRGYLIIYQDPGSRAAGRSRLDQFRNHMSMRRFDSQRITVVAGSVRDAATVQFWRVPPGAVDPTVLEANAEFEEPPVETDPSAPYIYATQYLDGIPGCGGRLFDISEYARVLIGEDARGNVVIGESTAARFRSTERSIRRELLAEGVPRARIRMFHKKVRANSLSEFIELWVVPARRSNRPLGRRSGTRLREALNTPQFFGYRAV